MPGRRLSPFHHLIAVVHYEYPSVYVLGRWTYCVQHLYRRLYIGCRARDYDKPFSISANRRIGTNRDSTRLHDSNLRLTLLTQFVDFDTTFTNDTTWMTYQLIVNLHFGLRTQRNH